VVPGIADPKQTAASYPVGQAQDDVVPAAMHRGASADPSAATHLVGKCNATGCVSGESAADQQPSVREPNP
jgi:hypothetical protein